MSFISRLFRKAPSVSPVPASALRGTPSPKADPAAPKPKSADRSLAAAAEHDALRAAIDAGNAQVVAQLVVAGTSTRIRQAAAQAIDDADVLRQLIREVRGGNDGSVYKILTAKRDAQLAEARKLDRVRAEIAAASADLEHHSRRAFDALYRARLDQFEHRWMTVAAQADPDLRSRVEQWIDRSRQTIAEHARQIAAQASLEQAAVGAAAEAQRIREQEAQASATKAVEQARTLDEQQRVSTEAHRAEQGSVRQIGELVRKARSALGEGSTARAAGMRRTLAEKLEGAPPLPASLASELQQLDQQLDHLKDWKRFSVTPKRAKLIGAMEALVGSTSEPLALAELIKRLQDEWRALSKGVGENHDADWQRFHEAAQKAYQPCREFFAAQAQVREENLKKRDALLADLTAFEAAQDPEQPDWRALIQILRDTKPAWRACSPVDRQAGKTQQAAFAAVTANLQGRLDAEYARNVARKDALIEQAHQQLATDDARKAIDAIKALQQQWRSVGPVPREADQRLWETFRQHCDAVFQKRQQALAAHAAGLEDTKTQAVGVCEQLERIATLEGPELLAHASSLLELRKAFEVLGELPRTDARALRDRLDRGLDRCKRAIARQEAVGAERAWDDLFEAANHVRAYQLAVAQRLHTEQVEQLKAAAETYIATVPKWPKNGLEALRAALGTERPADLAANESALKLLCVRAEILMDLPTPPEDQSLRRDYQLQRLVQNMGQSVRVEASQLDVLSIEWVGLCTVEESTYQPLLARFLRCRAAQQPS